MSSRLRRFFFGARPADARAQELPPSLGEFWLSLSSAAGFLSNLQRALAYLGLIGYAHLILGLLLVVWGFASGILVGYSWDPSPGKTGLGPLITLTLAALFGWLGSLVANRAFRWLERRRRRYAEAMPPERQLGGKCEADAAEPERSKMREGWRLSARRFSGQLLLGRALLLEPADWSFGRAGLLGSLNALATLAIVVPLPFIAAARLLLFLAENTARNHVSLWPLTFVVCLLLSLAMGLAVAALLFGLLEKARGGLIRMSADGLRRAAAAQNALAERDGLLSAAAPPAATDMDRLLRAPRAVDEDPETLLRGSAAPS